MTTPAHDLAFAVQVGEASAELRPERHRGDVLEQDRGAGFACADCDLLSRSLDALGRSLRPRTMNSVSAMLEQFAADIRVASLDGRGERVPMG